MLDSRKIITSPSAYFADFKHSPQPPAFLPMFGYYLASFSEELGNQVSLGREFWPATFRAMTSAVPGALLTALLFGVVWMYLGAKFVRGPAALRQTVSAVGLAFFWPAVFASFCSFLMAVTLDPFPGLAFLILAAQLGLAIWALILSGVAVKQINTFTNMKKAFVLLWFPLVGIIAVFVAVTLNP